MIYFSEPEWLWLLLPGLVIAVFVHLALFRRRRMLRVGSVSLLAASHNTRRPGTRIREWLLLALRMLGVLLAVFLLAGPFRHQPAAQRARGWVLIDPPGAESSGDADADTPADAGTREDADKRTDAGTRADADERAHAVSPADDGLAADKPAQAEIDSLLAAGFETHYLTPGFPRSAASSPDPRAQKAPYWPLLETLPDYVPAGFPVYLFTRSRLRRFSGARPALNFDLHWRFLAEPDTMIRWVSAALRRGRDSIDVLTGASQFRGTRFQRSRVAVAAATKRERTLAARADTGATAIQVFGDSARQDAGYLLAALNAVRRQGGRNLTVTYTQNFRALAAGSDWLFWLSEKGLPANLHPKHLLYYGHGRAQTVAGRFFFTSVPENQVVSLQRFFSPAAPTGRVLWSDGAGHPLLSVSGENETVYTLYTRLDPSWNGLPWSGLFPALIYDLLFPEAATAPDHDNDIRYIADSQALPVRGGPVAVTREKKSAAASLSFLCWALATLVFVSERFVAGQLKKTTS